MHIKCANKKMNKEEMQKFCVELAYKFQFPKTIK